MPSSWRTPLNTGYPSSHRPQPRKPQTTLLQALMSILLAPTRRSRKEAATSISPAASTRAGSLLRHRGAIGTGSTFVMSPNKRVSSAAANNPIRIIFATCNHGRSAAEQAWWKAAGIDPVKVARQLWRQTRLDDPQEHHQPGLAARPETRSIASAPDATRESRSDQVGVGRADDGRAP